MYYIGFDIGGTKCAAVVAKAEGGEISLLDRHECPTTKNPEDTLSKLLPFAIDWQKKVGFAAAGISCGGPLNCEKGLILNPPNLVGWHNFAINEYIKNILHVPVAIENDANACALAEWKYGAGRGSKNMVFLTFGTGLGAGLILNGRLYRGANGNAGEVGHMRLAPEGPVGYGKAGSFEGFCSGGGIASLALYLAAKRQTVPAVIQRHGNAVTAKILAEAAFDGDAFALEVYRKCGEMLGRGLALVCDILNPQLVVLGGVFMRSSALLVPSMTKALEAEALGVNLEVMKIVSAGLGEEIGDYAAVAVAAGIL